MIRIVAVFLFFGCSTALAVIGGFLINQEILHVFPVSTTVTYFSVGDLEFNALEFCIATVVGSLISGLIGFVLLTHGSTRE